MLKSLFEQKKNTKKKILNRSIERAYKNIFLLNERIFLKILKKTIVFYCSNEFLIVFKKRQFFNRTIFFEQT